MMAQRTSETTVLDQLLPSGLIVLVVTLVVLWAAKQFFGEFFKRAGAKTSDSAVRWLSPTPRFRRRQLRSYRRSVEQSFGAHPLGFAPDRVIDINEVYVPLQYEHNGERQGIYENLRDVPRSVVTGAAGAGKSLLLKNSMLMWARQEPSSRRERIPVLIDLHRCNGSPNDLVDHIAAELSRARLHRSLRQDRDRALVEQALQEGALSLLFDGLDEVGRDDQERVAQLLRDFGRQYPDCQVIVTCRNVVYQGQLAPEFNHVVTIAEFDDAGVIRLLSNWRGVAGTPAVAEIFGVLHKNPALMRLARNPLLLTMIAYLHTEVFSRTGRRLPTSRPAFYDSAITHLLSRDADLGRSGSLAIFDVGEKLAVLQRVALDQMELANEDLDRLTISRNKLVSTTLSMLPDLNLERSHVKGLLDEIIDRSQLLMALDKSKSQYSFRHQTLQEYLAAVELADKPELLLDQYLRDPLAWRETVKLWCGSSTRDCTKLVAEMFFLPEPHHKILALECLAEARRIDNVFASKIIDHFFNELRRPGPDRMAIVTALGSVAADNRPRGQQMLTLLKEMATSGQQPARIHAMQALAASGRLEGAESLAPLAVKDMHARAALRSMGELTVPVLITHARQGHLWAIDDLAVVGTPSAAAALVELLWSDDSSAVRSAWQLASLLRSPEVEAALQHTSQPIGIEPPMGDWKWANWIWKPFAVTKNDPLLRIVGRIYLLIHEEADGRAIPKDVGLLDLRVGIPLALMAASQCSVSLMSRAEHEQLRSLFPNTRRSRRITGPISESEISGLFAMAAAEAAPSESIAQVRERIMSRCRNRPAILNILLDRLPWPVVATILGQFLGPTAIGKRPKLRREDWSTVRSPKRASTVLWWIFGSSIAAVVVALIVAAVIRESQQPAWLPTVTLIGLVASFLAMLIFAMYDTKFSNSMDSLAILAFVFCVIGTIVIGTKAFFVWLPTPLFGVGGALIVSAVVVCGLAARRRDRITFNVFRRCLDAGSVQVDGRTSVIASRPMK